MCRSHAIQHQTTLLYTWYYVYTYLYMIQTWNRPNHVCCCLVGQLWSYSCFHSIRNDVIQTEPSHYFSVWCIRCVCQRARARTFADSKQKSCWSHTVLCIYFQFICIFWFVWRFGVRRTRSIVFATSRILRDTGRVTTVLIVDWLNILAQLNLKCRCEFCP